MADSLQIEKYRHDLEVIRDTALQVAKDFLQAGIQIRIPASESVAYEELEAQLIPVLNELMQATPDRLSQLLYRIDIDEKAFHSVADARELSRLILERELIKVLTRKLLKEKK